MIPKIQSLLSSPWNYAIVALVLCSALLCISCWRQLYSADVCETGTRRSLPAVAELVNDAQDGRSDAPTASPIPEGDSALPELELLSEIRQEIGSPTDRSLFQDVQSPDTKDDSFADTYRKEATTFGAAKAAFVAGDGLAGDETPMPWPEHAHPRIRHRQALRDAARLLDEEAADLEDSENFQSADDLRNWASRLRESARGETLSTPAID